MADAGNPGRNLIAMAFDSAMAGQARRCLESIREHCRFAFDLGVVAIDLPEEEAGWWRGEGAKVFSDLASLPSFGEAPRHAHAMTCRPYLREIFPGYDCWMYVDADVRFMGAEAFDFYLGGARRHPALVAAVQEVDPTYAFVRNPRQARLYHELKYARLERVYRSAVAEGLRYFHAFNAGIFAMHRESAIWGLYRKNLEAAMRGKYDAMLEQDALLVSIAESGMQVLVGSALLNWLCSVSMPRLDGATGKWVRPASPALPISVLHLTNSMERFPGSSEGKTWGEHYGEVGMV